MSGSGFRVPRSRLGSGVLVPGWFQVPGRRAAGTRAEPGTRLEPRNPEPNLEPGTWNPATARTHAPPRLTASARAVENRMHDHARHPHRSPSSSALCTVLQRAPRRRHPERTKPLKSLDLTAIDTVRRRLHRLLHYACGGWRKNNPVPGDKARWGRFDELREFNLYTLKDILEEASKPAAGADADREAGGRLLRLVHGHGGDRRGRAEADRAAISSASPRPRRKRTSSASWARSGATA